MSFLNPFLLFGAGAVAVPIIIHLLNRRKFQRVVWAAMRFVKTSMQQNQRRMLIEDMILLALRCLLLLLLALALARPAMRQSASDFFGQTKVTAVIVLDNSASMGVSDGVQLRFDKGRKAAEQVLDTLPVGSAASVFLASDGVNAVIAEPTHDLNLARKTLREAPLSDRATDLFPAIERAHETLRGRTALRKEVYVVTDGQQSGWRQLGDIQKLLHKAKDARGDQSVQTRVVLVGDPEERNLGVSDLRVTSGLTPVNRPLRFEVRVGNYGKQEAKDVRVTLQVNAEPAGDEVVIPSIPAGETRAVSLFARLHSEGFHSVTARIADDRFAADNKRTLVVRALREVRVLLVDGSPGAEPRDSETFFLAHALVPVPPEEMENYFVKPTVVPVSELGDQRLDDFDAVVLANVPEFPSALVTNFEQYLRRGGGLIIFPGGKVNANFYNEQLLKRANILPAALGEPRGDAAQEEKFINLQSKGYDHPIVSIWNDPGSGSLNSARFFRSIELIPIEAPKPATNTVAGAKDVKSQDFGTPKIVLRYADNSPAVVERPWGLGRVILFSSTATTTWNDLPVRPAFVPLVHRTLASIVQRQDEGLNLRVGQGFARRMGAEWLGKDAVILNPGSTGGARELRKVELVNGVPMLQYDATDKAGVYEISIADPPTVLKFATQPDPAESNLDDISAEDLKTLGEVSRVVRWSPTLSLKEMVEKERLGAEYWLPVALLAMLVAAVETFLAQYFSRSK